MLLRRITRDQVKLGMYVHAFEGPWSHHPFWLPRFRLTKMDDVTRIRQCDVPAVVIDESRGLRLHDSGAMPLEGATPDRNAGASRSPLSLNRARSFAEEKREAEQLVKHSTREMKRLFAAAHAGEGIALDAFAPLIVQVMASITRNPYALIAITRLKKRDEYTYVHSIAVSTLMASFARALGMPETEVFDLGLAGLLHDIGKMVVPERILRKPQSLTDAEFALVRTHPEQGYLLLSQVPAMPEVILDVCRHHHERLDGSGYPFRLNDAAISRAARIAAICDVYDALTSNRSYKAAWTSEEAITRMYDWTGHFDRHLLFAFMKVIGVYPPGLLVQLRSNRLGVTISNGRRASRPKVRAFFCSRNYVQLPLEDVVIEDDLAHDQIISEEYALDWGIVNWPLVAEQLTSGTIPRLPNIAKRDGSAAKAISPTT